MALQIEVAKGSVSKGVKPTPGLTATLNLTCWPDGVTKEYPVRNEDGTVDMKNAIIFQDFPEYMKAGVEGKTAEDLAQEAGVKIKKAMQVVIDKYNIEQNMLNSSLFEQVRAGVESALEG